LKYICDSYHSTIIQRMVLLDLCEMTHPVLGSEKSFDSDVHTIMMCDKLELTLPPPLSLPLSLSFYSLTIVCCCWLLHTTCCCIDYVWWWWCGVARVGRAKKLCECTSAQLDFFLPEFYLRPVMVGMPLI